MATFLLSELQKGYAHIDLSDCPDLAPILFAVAGLLHGATFTGTHRLKIKESDRAHAMQQELKKCGISLDVGENEVIVHGSTPHFPSAPIEAHNDHRIVMAMAVLLTQTGGVIQDAQVDAQKYARLFARLEALGYGRTYIYGHLYISACQNYICPYHIPVNCNHITKPQKANRTNQRNICFLHQF